jgi:phospholipid/cholesterol/gamma-HCH transport system substrate-binding protein
VGALALVVAIVAYIVFAGGGGSTYKLEFAEGDQLVRGDQVQVGGVPVGSITSIALTHDFKALVTIHVDSSLTPLHEGTTAQVRVPSLSSVANRYIAIEPGPNNKPALSTGAKLPASVTGEVTDLDQLFNTLNPKTRQGLQEFIQGTAEQYAGAGKTFGESTEYCSPTWLKTETKPSRRSAPSRPSSPRGCTRCPSRCARPTTRSPKCRPRQAR